MPRSCPDPQFKCPWPVLHRVTLSSLPAAAQKGLLSKAAGSNEGGWERDQDGDTGTEASSPSGEMKHGDYRKPGAPFA